MTTLVKRAGGGVRRTAEVLTQLPWKVELLLWLLVLAAAIAVRLYLQHLVPVYIWSKDSGGYLGAAVHWLDTGDFRPDARRGPVYSGFIALILWLSPNLTSVVVAQHVVGVLCILAGAAVVRVWFGRRGLVPLFFCALCYAVYGLPIYLEHLIRNETLLFALSTLLFASLALAFENRSIAWTAWSGLFLGLLNLTKKVFAPFPIVVVAALVLRDWRDWRRGALSIALFLAACAAPIAANTLYRSAAMDADDSGEYAGIQLYGRVAQWTWLEGGLYPEIKREIAPLVTEYRQRKKMDNNWVIKRGIVPRIAEVLPQTPARGEALDTICRRLAIEAIRKHPDAYARQARGDLSSLLFKLGHDEEAPEDDLFPSMATALRSVSQPHPVMNRDEVAALYDAMDPADHERKYARYFSIIGASALFETAPPVFLTTLLLPLVFWFSPRGRRLFWAATACIWVFNLVLLSTVGKPMHRYLMPVMPIMFLCLTSAVILAWTGLLALIRKLPDSRLF